MRGKKQNLKLGEKRGQQEQEEEEEEVLLLLKWSGGVDTGRRLWRWMGGGTTGKVKCKY